MSEDAIIGNRKGFLEQIRDTKVPSYNDRRELEIYAESDEKILRYIKNCQRDKLFSQYYYRYLLEKEYRGL